MHRQVVIYVPTQTQSQYANELLFESGVTSEQKDAANMVMSGYALQEKVHHDYIHIVNEFARNRTTFNNKLIQ